MVSENCIHLSFISCALDNCDKWHNGTAFKTPPEMDISTADGTNVAEKC